MSDLFPRVKTFSRGYSSKDVDAFMNKARASYERVSGSEQLGSLDVSRAHFKLTRGGYDLTTVDSALDRLENAFAQRRRDEIIKSSGHPAYLGFLAQEAQRLYPRLRRPALQRFAHPGPLKRGYSARHVDAILKRLTQFFDSGAPLTSHELRRVVFPRATGKKAYDEATVDAFLAVAVDILLAAEKA